MTDSTAKWHVPALDGIRGLSVLFVVLGHVLLFDSAGPFKSLGSALASTGVAMFFVLSGFLITSLLLREERAAGRVDVVAFYTRRFLRIFPAYFGFISCLLLLDRLHAVEHVEAHDYIASALFVRNLIGRAEITGHLWSLSLEEQFYLLWPAVIVLTSRYARGKLVAYSLPCFVVWRGIVVWQHWYRFGALYLRTDLRLDTILVGCMVALLGLTKFALTKAPQLGTAFLVVLAIALAHAGLVSPVAGILAYTALPLALAVALASVVSGSGVAARICSVSALRYLGRTSYSLYLWQQVFLLHHGWPYPLAVLPVRIFLLLLTAIASYELIERPIVRWKDRWAARRASVSRPVQLPAQ